MYLVYGKRITIVNGSLPFFQNYMKFYQDLTGKHSNPHSVKRNSKAKWISKVILSNEI